MKCPTCEKYIGWDWLEDECIEASTKPLIAHTAMKPCAMKWMKVRTLVPNM